MEGKAASTKAGEETRTNESQARVRTQPTADITKNGQNKENSSHPNKQMMDKIATTKYRQNSPFEEIKNEKIIYNKNNQNDQYKRTHLLASSKNVTAEIDININEVNEKVECRQMQATKNIQQQSQVSTNEEESINDDQYQLTYTTTRKSEITNRRLYTTNKKNITHESTPEYKTMQEKNNMKGMNQRQERRNQLQ
jgi:hypothetical protein